MRRLAIPLNFFVNLKKYPPIYSLMWVDWLSMGDVIMSPLFAEKVKYKSVPQETVINCYKIGICFFDNGILFEDDIEITKVKMIEEKSDEYDKDVAVIIQYLNEKANTKYNHKTPATKRLIVARIKEGNRVADFFKVIDNKYRDWKGTDWEKFLRPATLFAPSKFESYLNQKVNYGTEQKPNKFDSIQSAVDEAKQRLFQ